MKRPKVKTLDLMTLGKLHKDYSGAWGLYLASKDEIWLDKRLGKRPIPAKREILLHEKGHRLIEMAGVKMTDDQEEAFCDLWAIYKWPKKLTGLEKHLKAQIIKHGTLEGQIKALLKLIGASTRHASKIVKQLP